MKKILVFIFLCLPLFADVDAQIEAIQKAPVEERFKLMNAFKKEIVQMQEEERMHAIRKLQAMTQSKHAHKVFKELNIHTNARKSKNNTERKEHGSTETASKNETENHVESTTKESIETWTEEQTETEDSIENNAEEHVEEENQENIENETEEQDEDEHDDK